MRIFALDTSGSVDLMINHAIEHIQTTSNNPDKDMFVCFNSHGVSSPQLVSNIEPILRFRGGGDGTDQLIKWTNDRTLCPTDELIIYTDLAISDWITSDLLEGWFTPFIRVFKSLYSVKQVDRFRQAGISVEILPF